MLRIYQIKCNVEQPLAQIEYRICKKLKIDKAELIKYAIVKESIDARKANIYLTYTVDVIIKNETKALLYKNRDIVKLKPTHSESLPSAPKLCQETIAIVGFGPAGIFAALKLAKQGYHPVVIERGEAIDDRVQSVNKFWKHAILNEESNVQFGEGGAGTFSDGKLTSRIKDPRAKDILEILVAHGAPAEIIYKAHPHIGSDKLKTIVKNIRKSILDYKGKILFQSKLNDIKHVNGKLKQIKINDEWLNCDHLILAIGHSAQDTWEMLMEKAFQFVAKPFAVGLRIEHPQKWVNQMQYKMANPDPHLGVAEYRCSHMSTNKRGVYTFCMCPGGIIVPAASRAQQLVINGMSNYARDETNANSAILVQIHCEDFNHDPKKAMQMQRNYEQLAFQMGNKQYQAPAQLVYDFLHNTQSESVKSILSSYPLGIQLCNLQELLPQDIITALQEGILAFDQKIKGFANDDAILTGVETRSSSPFKMLRDATTLQALNVQGVYPCGEGAGYAGGIVSSAVDGLRCAQALINNIQKKYSENK